MPDSGDVKDSLTGLMPIVKSHVIQRDDVPGSSVQPSQEEKRFSDAGAVPAPFDMEMLCELFDHSNSLRQNIDAYVTNIDSFGHRLEPVIDIEDDEAFEKVKDAIFLERAHGKEFSDVTEKDMPDDEEVEKRLAQLKIEMRLERAMLENFFEFCCAEGSFVDLRRKNRQDIEAIGNGFWEVLRNGDGDVAQFNYIPGHTVRLLPMDNFFTEVMVKMQVSKLKTEEVKMKKRFRRFAQVVQSQIVFYKELGDPSIVSRRTGKKYEDIDKLRDEEGENALPAHEILHWAIHNPKSSYGVPRWIGNLLSVLGSRQAEEVNFLYFDSKGVPPMAILVSGGRMQQESVDRIGDFINNNIKGRKNFHSVLVIEAETSNTKSDTAGKTRIDMKPLNAAQHNDALFQKYDERNIDKVGMAFRLPRMLRGDIRDFNRSTADAALSFAEMQVFQPERQAFDFIINRQILSTELGVKYWRFVSNAPVTRDPKEMAEIIRNLSNANILTPELGLELASDVFNRDFKKIKEPWTKQPLPLTIAGFLPEGMEPPPEPGGEGDDFDITAADLSIPEGSPGSRQPSQDDKFRKLPPGIAKRAKKRQEAIVVKVLSRLAQLLEQNEKMAAEEMVKSIQCADHPAE